VIALDFPGFGDSAKLPADALPNAAALADAVEREMNQLGIGDFHVAGYSSEPAFPSSSPPAAGSARSSRSPRRAGDSAGAGLPGDGADGGPHDGDPAGTRRDADDRVRPRPEPVLRHGTQPAWKLTRQDARQLLLNFANASAYEETVLASAFDIPPASTGSPAPC